MHQIIIQVMINHNGKKNPNHAKYMIATSLRKPIILHCGDCGKILTPHYCSGCNVLNPTGVFIYCEECNAHPLHMKENYRRFQKKNGS